MIPLVIYAVTVLALSAGFGWFVRDLNKRHEAQVAGLLTRIQSPQVAEVAALEAIYGQQARPAPPAPEYVPEDLDLTFDDLIGAQ